MEYGFEAMGGCLVVFLFLVVVALGYVFRLRLGDGATC